MSFDLRNCTSSRSSGPPKIMIHAVKGKGKSSLAAEFPNPIYLPTMGESTPHDVDIPSTGMVTTWLHFKEAMNQIIDGEHEFKTLIIDTVDGLEPLVWAETCSRNKWASIEDPNYGKGYVAAESIWSEFIDGCNILRNERGMTIVCCAHSEISNHEEPGAQPYKRYDIKLQKRAEQLIGNWCDFILFINTKIEIKETEGGFNKKHAHAEGGVIRWIYTDARPAFVAKNRGAKMPPSMLYKRGEGYLALEPYLFVGDTKNGKLGN